MRTCLYILVGYLSGSILFANVFSALFHEKGAIEESKDKNPGTANAFLYGGFRCGMLTLICNLGKGIAVTFGSLLGMFPDLRPALLLAFFFLFYSLILRIIPHFYRTLVTYLCTMVGLLFVPCQPGVRAGFFLISLAVLLHFHFSKEEREQFQVKLLWMH